LNPIPGLKENKDAISPFPYYAHRCREEKGKGGARANSFGLGKGRRGGKKKSNLLHHLLEKAGTNPREGETSPTYFLAGKEEKKECISNSWLSPEKGRKSVIRRGRRKASSSSNLFNCPFGEMKGGGGKERLSAPK